MSCNNSRSLGARLAVLLLVGCFWDRFINAFSTTSTIHRPTVFSRPTRTTQQGLFKWKQNQKSISDKNAPVAAAAAASFILYAQKLNDFSESSSSSSSSSSSTNKKTYTLNDLKKTQNRVIKNDVVFRGYAGRSWDNGSTKPSPVPENSNTNVDVTNKSAKLQDDELQQQEDLIAEQTPGRRLMRKLNRQKLLDDDGTIAPVSAFDSVKDTVYKAVDFTTQIGTKTPTGASTSSSSRSRRAFEAAAGTRVNEGMTSLLPTVAEASKGSLTYRQAVQESQRMAQAVRDSLPDLQSSNSIRRTIAEWKYADWERAEKSRLDAILRQEQREQFQSTVSQVSTAVSEAWTGASRLSSSLVSAVTPLAAQVQKTTDALLETATVNLQLETNQQQQLVDKLKGLSEQIIPQQQQQQQQQEQKETTAAIILETTSAISETSLPVETNVVPMKPQPPKTPPPIKATLAPTQSDLQLQQQQRQLQQPQDDLSAKAAAFLGKGAAWLNFKETQALASDMVNAITESVTSAVTSVSSSTTTSAVNPIVSSRAETKMDSALPVNGNSEKLLAKSKTLTPAEAALQAIDEANDAIAMASGVTSKRTIANKDDKNEKNAAPPLWASSNNNEEKNNGMTETASPATTLAEVSEQQAPKKATKKIDMSVWPMPVVTILGDDGDDDTTEYEPHQEQEQQQQVAKNDAEVDKNGSSTPVTVEELEQQVADALRLAEDALNSVGYFNSKKNS